MVAGILVGLCYNPGWSIADPEVEDFALLDHGVQALHELRDRGCKVPPMHIEHVNVVRLQLVQRISERDVERFATVA